MKVVAINGSPKVQGNTAQAIGIVTRELENEGIDTEVIHVGNKLVRGCLACGQCVKLKNRQCVINGDDVNLWIEKMQQADGIILGSPVYFSAISGTMKCFLDRAFYVSSSNGGLFNRKIGAAVVAVRRSGGIPAFNQLNSYLNYAEMLMPTSNYWNVIHGAKPGEVHQDEEGVQIMRVLGKNMAWLLKLVENCQGAVTEPPREAKVYTNFIR